MSSFRKRDESNYKINSTKQCPRSTQNDGMEHIKKKKKTRKRTPENQKAKKV